jgi:hypothetical protein
LIGALGSARAGVTSVSRENGTDIQGCAITTAGWGSPR